MPDQSCPPTSAEADCAMDVTNDVPMAPASTESPPVPAAGAEKDENEPMSDVETKLAMLERRVQQLEEQVRAGVRSSPAPPTPLKREAAFTPDVFNPFWDEIVEGPSVPGAHAFPEAVLHNKKQTPPTDAVGPSFEEQWSLVHAPGMSSVTMTPDWNDASPLSTWPAPLWTVPSDDLVPSSVRRLPSPPLPPTKELVADVMSRDAQDASVTLQLLLKNGSEGQRAEIVDTIKPQLRKLASDKNGGYLVQRALTLDMELAWALRGSFALLSLSPYGALVVRRVLDGDEPLRLAVVQDLLSDRLCQTLTARNAIPVWHKVLRLAWPDHVLDTLRTAIHTMFRGRWADLATDEIGSTLCQKLMEYGHVPEHGACVTELMNRFVSCVCDQWGVWVIQYLVEHGSEAMQRRVACSVFSHLGAVSLSVYGSRAIQAMLRATPQVVAAEYAERLCQLPTVRSHLGSLRPLLIDLALTQQGLPIIAQLLTTAGLPRRTEILNVVRKNAPILQGNKSGMRVVLLCGTWRYLHRSCARVYWV